MITLLVCLFIAANIIVLAASIWISLSDALPTGFWGTFGFAMIGLSAAINLSKPIWMREAIDGPEILMLVGMAVVGIWMMVRKVYWHNKGGRDDTY
ncbi:holin [Pandoraea pneumonica]|uniref:Holin n=1 Tax=Pandoraea pneumonica TaxID=2508299 RepID=A0A5E4RP82_9BURK|nr:holin [Pandoraea pneumonica]VVD64212.1 holin [Pandoraea pneumonica]